MSQNYTVNYNINVNSQAALSNIVKFQQAITALKTCESQLASFEKKMQTVNQALNKMSKSHGSVKIGVKQANKDLDSVIVKLNRIHALASKIVQLRTSYSVPPTGVPGTPGTPGATGSRRPPARGKNAGYRIFGPSMMDTGGIGAFSMLKGMGMAYGITAIGSWVSNIVKSFAEFDNSLKTTYNILKTHDKESGFDSRFQDMSRIIRNVGMATKFTAPEVADASKFLAMAGFNLEDINKSIVPISNLALIGDTELGKTADITTNIMTGYGIAADQIGKASDIMAMTFTSSNTTLTEIAEAYKYSASLLSAGGIGFEEATAALGVLGDAGIKGSQAGTTMRTIMANIVKPTKIQAEHWEKVGVARLNEDGSARDLVSIFEDLHKKDLQVSDFYRLFHKTAAQGAVSLTNNIDKFQEVIRRNLFSDGLAHQLAEEKKNTLQGLWHQLSSSFLDSGIKAFSGIEGSLRQVMLQTIDWAKSPEAIKTFQKIFENVADILGHVLRVTKTILTMSPLLTSFMTGWLKLQIYAAPIMIFVRACRALFAIGSGIPGFLAKFATLKATITGAGFLGTAGFVGGVAAIGGAAIYGIVQAVMDENERINLMVNDITRWSDKIFLANGYLTEGIDPATKYLSLVYDKQLSVNEKVEEYIRLRKEEMGLIPTQPTDKKVRDIAPEIDGIWGLPDKWLYSTTQTWMGVKPILKHLPDDIQSQYQVNTSPLNSYFTKGGGRISKDNAIIDIAGYALGKTSPETQGIIDFYTKELRNAPLSQWGIIFDRLENKKREMESLVDPAMADITAAKMAELPAKELLKIPSAWSGALAQINAAFDLDGESIFAKQLRGYKEYLADSKQKSLESNWRLFATQGIPSFVSLLNGGTEQDVWNDIITNRGWSPIQQTFVGDNKQSADQYAATFYAAFVKPVYDIMSSFPKDIQSQFAVWLDSPIVKKAIEMNRLRIGKGKEQEEEDYDPLSPNKTTPSASEKGYEQQYRSNSAAPKQIIVQIENMMNVESVDLSNPENKAAVENVKQQLAQALIDVVHDFDVSFHS